MTIYKNFHYEIKFSHPQSGGVTATAFISFPATMAGNPFRTVEKHEADAIEQGKAHDVVEILAKGAIDDMIRRAAFSYTTEDRGPTRYEGKCHLRLEFGAAYRDFEFSAEIIRSDRHLALQDAKDAQQRIEESWQ